MQKIALVDNQIVDVKTGEVLRECETEKQAELVNAAMLRRDGFKSATMQEITEYLVNIKGHRLLAGVKVRG